MTRKKAVAARQCIAVAAIVLAMSFEMAAQADFAAGLEAYDAGDFAAAIEAWRPLADAGDAEAQSALGGLYLAGEGVAADPARAARWFRRAAEQGDAVAQLNLGDLYDRGLGVPRDPVQAYLWLTLAAAQGRLWAERRRREVAGGMTRTERAAAERLIATWPPPN